MSRADFSPLAMLCVCVWGQEGRDRSIKDFHGYVYLLFWFMHYPAPDNTNMNSFINDRITYSLLVSYQQHWTCISLHPP